MASQTSESSTDTLLLKEKQVLFVLSAGHFIFRTDYLLLIFSGSLMLSAFDISAKEYASLAVIYSVFAFASSVFGIFYLDRFDRKKALMITLIGFWIGLIISAFSTEFWHVIVARSITGLFGGLIGVLILTIIGDEIPYKKRSQAFGMLAVANALATVIGLCVGMWLISAFFYRLPFIILAALMPIIAFANWVHLTSRPSVEAAAKEKTKAKLTPNVSKAMLFNILFQIGYYAFLPFLSIFLKNNIGFTDNEIILIFLIGGVFIIPASIIAGKTGSRIGNRTIYGYASVLFAALLVILDWIEFDSLWVAILIVSGLFVTAGVMIITGNTVMTAVVSEKFRGRFLSLRSATSQATNALGPLIAGFILIENADGTLTDFFWVCLFAAVMAIASTLISGSFLLYRPEDEG